MTPAQIERLAILSEELGEVQQLIGKVLRFGYASYHPDDVNKRPNHYLLAVELGHVKAAIKRLTDVEDLNAFVISWSKSEKLQSSKKWLRHQD